MAISNYCVISTTEEETTEFKQYLEQYHPEQLQAFDVSEEQTFLAVWFNKSGKVCSHQTLNYLRNDSFNYERVKTKYFVIRPGVIPFKAFKNPELYPEYFI